MSPLFVQLIWSVTVSFHHGNRTSAPPWQPLNSLKALPEPTSSIKVNLYSRFCCLVFFCVILSIITCWLFVSQEPDWNANDRWNGFAITSWLSVQDLPRRTPRTCTAPSLRHSSAAKFGWPGSIQYQWRLKKYKFSISTTSHWVLVSLSFL